MKKNLLKIVIPVVILVLIVTIYNTKSDLAKGTDIDMQGKDGIVSVSLNINTGYDNQIIVKLVTEDFEPPSQVFVDILAKDKSIYTNKLEKEENDKFPDLGIYKDNFDSIRT